MSAVALAAVKVCEVGHRIVGVVQFRPDPAEGSRVWRNAGFLDLGGIERESLRWSAVVATDVSWLMEALLRMDRISLRLLLLLLKKMMRSHRLTELLLLLWRHETGHGRLLRAMLLDGGLYQGLLRSNSSFRLLMHGSFRLARLGWALTASIGLDHLRFARGFSVHQRKQSHASDRFLLSHSTCLDLGF